MIDWSLGNFLAHFTYSGVAIVLILAGFGIPIPEDIPLVIGGYLCGRGDCNLVIMLPLCIAAVFGGDSILYFLGKKHGHHLPRLPWLRHYLTKERLTKSKDAFHRHGGKTLFAARFMPGVRAAIFFTAGHFKLPYSKMVIFDGGAALISVPVWILLGYWFHEHIDAVFHKIEEAKSTAAIVIGALLLFGVGFWIYRRKRRKKSATSDLETAEPKPQPAVDPESATSP